MAVNSLAGRRKRRIRKPRERGREREREGECDLPGRIERHKMLEEGRSHEEASVTFFLTLSLSLCFHRSCASSELGG